MGGELACEADLLFVLVDCRRRPVGRGLSPVRIATWNVNSLTARLPRVEEWIAYARPDVLCLQETKQADAAFPHGAFAALGYESAHHGDGRWNGVAIVSRVGLDDVATGLGSSDDDEGTRLIAADCGGVRVLSAYVPERPRPRRRALPGQAGLAGPPARPPRRDVPRPTGRWPCAATSTWPPRTGTCGTRPSS